MTRYYFPSWDGDRFLGDGDGIELDGLDEARCLALTSLAEMARDVLPQSLEERVLRVCLTDGGPEPLLEFRLTFQALVKQ